MTSRARVLYVFLFAFLGIISAVAQVKEELPTKIKKKDLELSSTFLGKGISEFNRGEYDLALNYFNMAIGHNQNNWVAARWRADAERALGQFDDAIRNYSIVLQKEKDPASYYGRAEARRSKKELDSALNDYKAALNLLAENYEFREGIANCYYSFRNTKKIIESYSWCVAKRPDKITNYSRRGFGYYWDDQHAAALQDFRKYFALGGTAPAVYYFRATTYYELMPENILYSDSVIADLKMFLKDDAGGGAHALLGGAYATKGDSTSARREFRSASEEDPDNPKIYNLWSKAEINFGNFEKAYALAQRQSILQKTPDSDLCHVLGMSLVGQCRIKEALAYFEKALLLDSLSTDVHRSRIAALHGIATVQDSALVFKDLDFLIGQSKESKMLSALHAKKSVLYLRLGVVAKSKEELGKSLAVSESDPILHILKGLIMSAAHEPKKSVQAEYDQAVSMGNDQWQPWLMRSFFYRELGDRRNSCVNLEHAIKLGAKPSDSMKAYLCFGKGKLEQDEQPINFIVDDALSSVTIFPRRMAVKCENMK